MVFVANIAVITFGIPDRCTRCAASQIEVARAAPFDALHDFVQMLILERVRVKIVCIRQLNGGIYQYMNVVRHDAVRLQTVQFAV